MTYEPMAVGSAMRSTSRVMASVRAGVPMDFTADERDSAMGRPSTGRKRKK